MGWFGPSGDCSCCDSGPLACCDAGSLGQATLSNGTGCEVVAHGTYGVVTHLGGCSYNRNFSVLSPKATCLSGGDTWAAHQVQFTYTIVDSGGVSATVIITWEKNGAATASQTRYDGSAGSGCSPWTFTINFHSHTDPSSEGSPSVGSTMTLNIR